MEVIGLVAAVLALSFFGGLGFVLGIRVALEIGVRLYGPLRISNTTTNTIVTLPAVPVPERNINQGQI